MNSLLAAFSEPWSDCSTGQAVAAAAVGGPVSRVRSCLVSNPEARLIRAQTPPTFTLPLQRECVKEALSHVAVSLYTWVKISLLGKERSLVLQPRGYSRPHLVPWEGHGALALRGSSGHSPGNVLADQGRAGQ